MRIDCKCGKGLTEDLSEVFPDFDEYGSVIFDNGSYYPNENDHYDPRLASALWIGQRHSAFDLRLGPSKVQDGWRVEKVNFSESHWRWFHQKMKSGVFFYTPERHPHRDIGEGPTMLTFTPLGLGVAEIPHIPTGIAVGLGSILAGVIPELPPTKWDDEFGEVIDVEGWNGRWYGCCNWADLELECECGNTLGLVEIDCEQLDMVTFYKENVVQSS